MKWPKEVEAFRRWAGTLVLDSDERFEPEGWQLEVVRDYLAGLEEIWLVVPEGNGKTTLLAAIALHHLEHRPSASVPIGASTRDQAEVLYRQARGFIVRTPELQKKFRPYDGFREIRSRKANDESRLKVHAADDASGDGVIPTLAMLDELHRHKNLRLYRTWRGKLEKRGGQLLTISTAGDPTSEFEDVRTLFRAQATDLREQGPYIRAASDVAVLHDWAVRDQAQTTDLERVAEANPLKSITAETLRKRYDSPTMTPEHWQRFVCNIATRIEGQAVAPAEWDRLAEPGMVPDPSAWTVAWLDLGWKVDTTAMGVLVWESHSRRLLTGVKVLQPPVLEEAVVQGLLDLQRRFPHLEGVVFDPNAGGQQMAQLLEKGTHPLQDGEEPLTFFEHQQTNDPMATAAARFDEAIRLGWLRHDGDRMLRTHVLNAYRKALMGDRWRYDRPPDAQGERRKKYPIDALTGAIMGHSYAVATHDDQPAKLVVY